MKKKTAGKTISFHGQWQSKPEFREMIYLFKKNEAAVLRVQLAIDITLSQQNLVDKLLKIYKIVMSFVGLDKNQLKLAT